MKRNGMCPLCYIKTIFTPNKKVKTLYFNENYNNGVALTPPMGWSSWNTFHNQINEDLMLDTARAMKDTGLVDVGYIYLNMDDNWHSSQRTAYGELQGDYTRFPMGILNLVDRINSYGLKAGIYSSNGTHTCEDLPASLGREKIDSMTFAKWGIEYFKYDFCHNQPISRYAPLVYSISIGCVGEKESQEILCADAILSGTAKLMHNKRVPGGLHISGLDAAKGKADFKTVYVEEDGDYVLTLNVRKKGKYEKFIFAEINGENYYPYEIPSQNEWNYTARFQQIVKLKKGANVVTLFNPIATRADSAMLQYYYMGQCIKEATKAVSNENGTKEKPIVYSICEHGKNEPYKWGRKAGNLWRTTADITAIWPWIVHIYEKNVDLYKYAAPGAFNDPDMLEVGNGSLTQSQEIAHFSLWCMMASPLILGNDIRSIKPDVIDIVTNRAMIAIDQDALGKQAKRISKGMVDILAKPLSNGDTAICFFNKGLMKVRKSISLDKLMNDKYVNMIKASSYIATDLWSNETIQLKGNLPCTISRNAVRVFRVSAKH